MSKRLPPQPNLKHLKLQAKRLHKAHGQGLPAACARVAAHYPPLAGKPAAEVRGADFTLCHAQLVVAREYGFESWRKMVATAFPPRPKHESKECVCCDGGRGDRAFVRVPYGAWMCRSCAADCRAAHGGGTGAGWSAGGRCSVCRRTEEYGTPVAFHEKIGLCRDCLAHMDTWPGGHIERTGLREEQRQILATQREDAYVKRFEGMVEEWAQELWGLYQNGLPDAAARVAAALPERPAGTPLTLGDARDVMAREVLGKFDSWSEYAAVVAAVRARRGKPRTAEQLVAAMPEGRGYRPLSVERYAYDAPGGHDVYTAFLHYVDGQLYEDTRKGFRRDGGWHEQLLRVDASQEQGLGCELYFDQATGGRGFSLRGRPRHAWKSLAAAIPIGAMTPVFALAANAAREPRLDGLTVAEIIAANEMVVVASVEIQLLA